jgi:hypothetical protein
LTLQLLDLGVEETMQLVLRDHAATTPPFADNENWPSYLSRRGDRPKLLYKLFTMFSRLPGRRVEAHSTHPNVGVLATEGEGAVGVLAYNFDWSYPAESERATAVPVELTISGVPQGRFSIQRMAIDRDHSGTPAESLTMMSKSSTLTLPEVTLAPSSVTLWLIARDRQ